MARVAITGAAGRIGSETIAALGDHQLTGIDVEPVDESQHDDLVGRQLDVVEEPDELIDATAGADVLVHLAAHADPYETWENVLELNIGGTYNAFEAARENEIDRIVFASSNHVTHMHNIDDPGSPETMVPDAQAIHTADPMGPDSYYGISKVTGEAFGSYYARRYGMEVVNLRIGWYLTPEDLQEYQNEDENIARYARAMFLSPRDCRDVLRRAVEASLPENPLTVNVTSRNQDRYLSLTHTIRALGYRPVDDSAEIVDGG